MDDTLKKMEESGQEDALRKKISHLEDAVVELKLNVESLRKNEDRLLAMLESMDDLLFIIGLDGCFNRFYQKSDKEDLFLPPKKFLGKHVKDVFPAQVAELFQKAMNAVETYGQTQQFDFLMVLDQRQVWFNAKISPFKPASQDYFGYVCEMRNVTERKQIEENLRESEARYRAVMQQSPVCILLADIDTRVILDGNPAIQRLLGYEVQELAGLSLYDLMAKEREDIYRKILKILQDRPYFIGERKLRRKDGTFVDAEITVNLISFKGKNVFCIFARDVTPRILAEKQLIQAATHDPLTGLVNRLLVYDRLAQELARARRHERKLALIYIDLDRFKEINDKLGHSIGDQLLKAVGIRIKTMLRETDTLARMGGDEYMIVVPEVKQMSDVDQIAQNILEAIRRPYNIDGLKHHITASVGIGFYPEDGRDSETLIKAADLAMYFAKGEGRNTCRRFTSEMKIRDISPES